MTIRSGTDIATIGDLKELRQQNAELRLAVGSLLDIMAEVAGVVGGDEAWKDLTREVLEKHKTELGFRSN